MAETIPNKKLKSVYFNMHDTNDLALFQYTERVGKRNFSGYMKRLLFEDMKRRKDNNNPYDYAIMIEPIQATDLLPTYDSPKVTTQNGNMIFVPVEKKQEEEEFKVTEEEEKIVNGFVSQLTEQQHAPKSKINPTAIRLNRS